MTNRGLAALSQGHSDCARLCCGEGLALSHDVGVELGIAFALEGLAGVAAGQGERIRAARLWGAAEALRETIGAPLLPADRVEFERMIAAARALINDAAWNAA